MRIRQGNINGLGDFVSASFAVPSVYMGGMSGLGDFVDASFAVPSVYMGGMSGLGDFVDASFAVPSNYLGMSGLGCAFCNGGCDGMGDTTSDFLTSIETGFTNAWNSVVGEATTLGVPATYAPYVVGAAGIGLAMLLFQQHKKRRGR